MKNTGRKFSNRHSSFAVYTMAFCVCTVLIYCYFFLYGKTLLWSADGMLQHYPYLVKVRHMIGEFVRGNGLELWSWDTGLGADVIGNYATILFDPFAYIAMAFPKRYLDYGYTVSIIVRLYFIGIAFLYFGRKVKLNSFQRVVGALGITFSSWVIGASVRHAFFLNAPICFILLIAGLEKILKKESPLVFIFTVFASLLSSFYFSYMSAIGVIIYFVIRYFVYHSQGAKKNFFICFAKICGYALVGAMLAMPVLMQVLYTILRASKGTGVEINLFYTLTGYLQYLMSICGNIEFYGNYSLMGLSALFIIMIPVMFRRNRERKSAPFIMWLVCMFMMAFPVFGSMFNGFSYSVGRWAYILVFFFVWSAVECLDAKILSVHENRTLQGIFIVCFSFLSIVIGKNIKNVVPDVAVMTALANCIFGLLYLFAFQSFIQKEKGIFNYTGRKAVILLLIFNIAVIYNFKYNIAYSTEASAEVDEAMDGGEIEERLAESKQRIGPKINDKGFYRIDQVADIRDTFVGDVPTNENIYFNNKSVYTYFSTMNSLWHEYNRAICNNAGYSRRICVASNDNRVRSDFLLGVKYFLGSDIKEDDKQSSYATFADYRKKVIDGVEVLENSYNIGLGCVYDSYISEEQFYSLKYEDRENAMLSAAVLSKGQPQNRGINKAKTASLTAGGKKIPFSIRKYKNVKKNKKEFKAEKDNATIELKLNDKPAEGEIYIVFKNLRRKVLPFEELLDLYFGEEGPTQTELKRFEDRNTNYGIYNPFTIRVKTGKVEKHYQYMAGNNQGYVDLHDYMLNVGTRVKNGRISVSFSATGRYQFSDFYILNVPKKTFEKNAAKLQKNKFNIVDFSNNNIKGTVDAKKDGILYLSILYDESWNIYIDGKKVDKSRINIAFTGCEVKKGKHTIELRYCPIGIKYGTVFVLVGLIFAIIIHLYYRRKTSK